MLEMRAATVADVPELLRFWAVAGENGSRPADRPDLVRRLINHDPGAVIVTELNSRIVGTVICGWDGWRGSLYRLAVAPELRGQGIGSALIRAAEDRLTALGAERYHAMVLDENELGQAAWVRAGYQRQAEWSRWVKPRPAST